MDDKRAVIVTNGEIEDLQALRKILLPTDTLIAADGGMRHLAGLDLLPTVLIGDLDSLPPELEAKLRASGVEILRHPVEKDATDLELALEWVLERRYKSICIAGALGGRLDHTLGNVFLLSDPRISGLDVRLDDGTVEAFLIREEAAIQGAAGELVSLLPIWGEARGIRTEGLYYPLRGETLVPYRTRGISNVIVSGTARVSLSSGTLLCIHTRQSTHPIDKE